MSERQHVVYDEIEEHRRQPEGKTPEQQKRPPLFETRVTRGKSSWRYTRADVARVVGLTVAAVRGAEKHQGLKMDDLLSVAAFIARRALRQKASDVGD